MKSPLLITLLVVFVATPLVVIGMFYLCESMPITEEARFLEAIAKQEKIRAEEIEEAKREAEEEKLPITTEVEERPRGEDVEATERSKKEGNDADVASLRRRAERGDAEAQFELANVYLKRDDPNKGLEWLRKAAEAGHAGAQATIGSIYCSGLGVAKDPAEAFKWCCKALAQGTLSEVGEKTLVKTIREIRKGMTDDEFKRLFIRLVDNGELSIDELKKASSIAKSQNS